MKKQIFCIMGLATAIALLPFSACSAAEGEIHLGWPEEVKNRSPLWRLFRPSANQQSDAPENMKGNTWAKSKDFFFRNGDGKTGKIHIKSILDAKTADAEKPDCLKINFSEQADFSSPDTIVAPIEIHNFSGNNYARFGPLEAEISENGRKMQIILAGQVQYGDDGRQAVMAICVGQVAWSKIKLGDREWFFLMSPNNVYADFPVPEKGNAVRCVVIPDIEKYQEIGINISAVGQPVMIDNKFYDASISSDGKMLDVVDYAGPMGTLELPSGAKTLILVTGKMAKKDISAGKIPVYYTFFDHKRTCIDKITLPEGEYTILHYSRQLTQKGCRDILIDFSSSRPDESEIISVKSGQVEKLKNNKVFVFTPLLKVKGSTVTVTGVHCSHKLGLEVTSRQAAGKIAFYSEDGKLVHEHTLEYG